VPSFEENPQAVWTRILNDARWAQNAHNVQSWSLEVQGDGTLLGGLEPSRLLPATDPIARQLVISLGTLTEAAARSAALLGYELRYEWIGPRDQSVVDNPGQALFRWELVPSSSARANAGIDGLTAATVKYRMQPAAIDHGLVDIDALAARLPGVSVTLETGTSRSEETATLAREAFRIEMETEQTALEFYELTRLGNRERRETPWGLSLTASFRRRSFWLVDPITTWFRQDPAQFAAAGATMFSNAVDLDGPACPRL
jgi:hypothetical protein